MNITRALGPLLLSALFLAPVAMAAGDVSSRAVGYICSAESGASPAGAAKQLVMVRGVGTGGFPIVTTRPEAQTWFNYGMALAHAFYHDDAILAFRRAREIDPACAMCAWGEAWSEGPTINYDVSTPELQAAAVAGDRAEALAGGETPKNRALISALKLRNAAHDAAADQAFAGAMDELSRRYAQDDEIAVLTSDAWLITTRNHRGGGVEGQASPRAAEVLEPVLKRHPDNTAAIHFYIHATEQNGEAGKALPYAARLGGLAPGASHLVHMASHTFFRVGQYEDAAVANAQAIGVDGVYLRAAHDPILQGRVRYHAHNLRFGLGGALASGDAPLALRLADHAAFAFPKAMASEGDPQLVAAQAYAAYGRYAPDRALALPDPGAKAAFAAALRHYARGEAFAAKGDLAGLRAEIALVAANPDAVTQTPYYFHPAAEGVLRVATLTLQGRAAMLDNQPVAAVAAYRAAVAIETDKLQGFRYHDPPPWWFPERRSLAAALLAAGKPAEAATEARAALQGWPREPLTMQVLGEAEKAQGDLKAAARDLAEAHRGWRGGAMPLARI